MLILPRKIIDTSVDENFESNYNILRFNETRGSIKDCRSEIYLRKINAINFNTDSIDMTEVNDMYDVILISQIIKKLSGINAHAFCKIVHHFNGISKMTNNKSNLAERFKNMILFPNISYSVGEMDDNCIFVGNTNTFKISKALFIKHGTRTISNVEYCESMHLPFGIQLDEDNMKQACGGEEMDNISKYFDITDPQYPEAHFYEKGNYSRCLEMKSKYTGSELMKLDNLSLMEINVSPSVEEEYEDRRSANIRRALMDSQDPEYDKFNLAIMMRIMLRNMVVDFMKTSICGLMNTVELIYYHDINANINQSTFKKVNMPVDKLTDMFYTNLSIINRSFEYLCKTNTKDIINEFVKINFGNLVKPELRIYLCDRPFELIAKISLYNNGKVYHTETIRMLKTEALHDYIIEGMHNNSSGMTTVRSLDLLVNKEN